MHVAEVKSKKYGTCNRGVDKFFKTLAKLASNSVFLLVKSENNWPKTQKGSVRGKNNPRQHGEWVYICIRQS
jgi:hypothetical protein